MIDFSQQFSKIVQFFLREAKKKLKKLARKFFVAPSEPKMIIHTIFFQKCEVRLPRGVPSNMPGEYRTNMSKLKLKKYENQFLAFDIFCLIP